jgi:hypothetical protein
MESRLGESGNAPSSGTRGRAAWNPQGIGGIARRAVMGIEAEAREGELHHVGFADDDGTRLAQAANDDRVPVSGRRVAQSNRACKRRLARHVEEILDRDDCAVERAERETCAMSCIGCIGGKTRRILIEAQKHPLVGRTAGEARQNGFELVSDRRHEGTG